MHTFLKKALRPRIFPSDYLCCSHWPCVCVSISMLFIGHPAAEDPPCPPTRAGVLQYCCGMAGVHTGGLGLQDALHITPAQQCCHRRVLLCAFISLNTLERSNFFQWLGSWVNIRRDLPRQAIEHTTNLYHQLVHWE